MSVLTLVVACWFMGAFALDHFARGDVGGGVLLSVLAVIFIVAALYKAVVLQEDDLPE